MTLNDLKKKFEEDCYLQLGNLHAKIDLSQIIEITWNSALLEVLEKMKQLPDSESGTTRWDIYKNEVIKIVEGMKK